MTIQEYLMGTQKSSLTLFCEKVQIRDKEKVISKMIQNLK